MTTHIVQRMNGTVLPTNHDERISIHLQSEIITGLGNLAGMSGEEPAGSPDSVKVGTIDRFVGMKFSGQSPTGAAFGQQRLQQSGRRCRGFAASKRVTPPPHARLKIISSTLHIGGFIVGGIIVGLNDLFWGGRLAAFPRRRFNHHRLSRSSREPSQVSSTPCHGRPRIWRDRQRRL